MARLQALFTLMAIMGLLPFPVFSAGKARKLAVQDVKGTDYVLLRDVAEFYGFPGLTVGDRAIELKSKWTTVSINRESRLASINNIRIWLQLGSRKLENGWAISHLDLQHTLDPVLRPHAHLHKHQKTKASGGC